MVLLIPGRHHLITTYQIAYLKSICSLLPVTALNNQPISFDNIEAIVFAITSSNHSNTRRNPLPFYLRSIAIEAAAIEFDFPVYIYGVNDVGLIDDFADFTIKTIKHESEGLFDLMPSNTFVVCSTPVLLAYQKLGYTILPAELADAANWTYHQSLPWQYVEAIAYNTNWHLDSSIINGIYRSSLIVWQKYRLDKKVAFLFQDDMIGADGDLTTTRDYNVYVRQMDEIAALKYHDTATYIQSGRIGDIGCAVGSWIKLACKEAHLRESDFYGVEVSRPLYEVCKQRKENGEFENNFVFFLQKNAVTGLVFEPNSMNTIHTSSLTHEIESYGSKADLIQFIYNRFQELCLGGVWINRDVIGPENKNDLIYLWLDDADGFNENIHSYFSDRVLLSDHLRSLSTKARFYRFATDFRKEEGYRLAFEEVVVQDKKLIRCTLGDACEYLSRKDYCDNWVSEMHETFCFWTYSDWLHNMTEAGFKIHKDSHAYRNEWIVANRWQGKAIIYNLNMEVQSYPNTTMILIGVK